MTSNIWIIQLLSGGGAEIVAWAGRGQLVEACSRRHEEAGSQQLKN